MRALRDKGSFAVATLLLLATGCGGGGGSASDAGQDGSTADAGARADGSVPYRGATRGGKVPDAPEYVAPDPADGPFEVDTTCCDRTLSFDALDGETAAVLEADFDVLDEVELSLSGGTFTTEQCMPEGTAIRYRLVVTSNTDGGVVESPRVDPDQPILEDAEGELYNLFVLESCD